MKRFIKEKIAVKCETKEELKDFLQRCENEGLLWKSGDKATYYAPFCPATIQYDLSRDKRLTYGGLDGNDIKKGWEVITYKEYFKREVETITINRYGNKVVAKYGNKVGVAKCNPEDEFNFETGAKLAFERLFGTEVKEVNRGAKVGEYIKVVNPFMTAGKYKKDDIFKAKSVDNNYNVCVVEHMIIIRRDEYVVLEGYKPEPQKEQFKPYLFNTSIAKHCGYIGEKTNLTALFGEELYVGDVVEYYSPDKGTKNKCVVVKEDSNYYVMGCSYDTTNMKNGIGKSGWQYRKVRSYTDAKHNEVIDNNRYILKEDN